MQAVLHATDLLRINAQNAKLHLAIIIDLMIVWLIINALVLLNFTKITYSLANHVTTRVLHAKGI